jgi:stage II sporulation protein D
MKMKQKDFVIMLKKVKQIPEIEVGIVSDFKISVTLKGNFRHHSGLILQEGTWLIKKINVKITLINGNTEIETDSGVILSPENADNSSFTVHSVTIGVDFHWQRREDQVFKGNLKLITEEEKITVINVLSVEDYLESVISSEMKATSSVDLLKAHAVISRGWLLAQIEKRKSIVVSTKKYQTSFISDNEIVKWYDREDHISFDVCADDHCQRYQGITRASAPLVRKVIEETFGEVMVYNGNICDTRYSKCCGGITELFENAWEPVNHPYLQRVVDSAFPVFGIYPDLQNEENAEKWITSTPDAFCNTTDKNVLTQVLNDYDQETNDFFRWKIEYTRDELSSIVNDRTSIDFGLIENIIPVERGVSGRITRLKIEGTKKAMIIGKELEIRKALSRTHLYSSCFFVEKLIDGKDIKFILKGAGWGHGVGLCQIGAAVMGSKGYTYKEILNHYFTDAELVKRY